MLPSNQQTIREFARQAPCFLLKQRTKMARGFLVVFLLLAGGDLFAAEPEPQYTRTRDLPALKMSFTDMQFVLDKAAHLLSDANKAASEANEAKTKEGKNRPELFLFRQSSAREALTLGTGPDEIKIEGHRFPANARVPKAAYALSYSYSWAEVPVSKLDLDLRDYGRRLSVTGTAVDQVEAISAALEADLSQHSAIGGNTVRSLGSLIIGYALLVSLVVSGAYCIYERQWRFLGVPIFSLLGLALLFVLPLREVFAGFALYQGEPSVIVRYEPQIAFGGLIITILLSFLIPMWRDAVRKKTNSSK
jgi:hypothetical protein